MIARLAASCAVANLAETRRSRGSLRSNESAFLIPSSLKESHCGNKKMSGL